jgi:hypothetical protein
MAVPSPVRLLPSADAAVRAAAQGEPLQSGWLVGLLSHDAAPPVVLHAVGTSGPVPEQFGAHPRPQALSHSLYSIPLTSCGRRVAAQKDDGVGSEGGACLGLRPGAVVRTIHV